MMKGKRARYRLSPNEEAQLLKEETEKRRKLRLQQVREQSKQNAARIRQAVKDERNRQLQEMAADLQDQLEQEKLEKIRHLENQYENSLRSIGQGHKEASRQVDVEEERYLMQLEDNKRAEGRYKAAIERERRERMFMEHEEKYHIVARQAALEMEKERASKIASLPAPPPDPLLQLETNKRKPVKMTDIDNFTTTHYHLREEYTVDRANPQEQIDAKKAAEEEQVNIEEQDKALIRLRNDRQTRAVVRHNAALEKELLSHDYGRILHDLSDLQRADREERQKVVANIPKQVFEPPHRRMEDKEERQREIEEAFEDMYMADTNYLGDISLALDPNPPADSTTVSESPDVSTHTATPLREPTLTNIPAVLRDTTNLPREGETTSPKKPEKVLRKLMDRIKNQRQEWMSKSLQEAGEPGGGVKPDIYSTKEPRKYTQDDSRVPPLSEYSLSETASPDQTASTGKPAKQADTSQGPFKPGKEALLHPMEAGDKIRQTAKGQPGNERSVNQLLEQQKEIEEQKRQLEKKLKELEEKQKILNQSAASFAAEPCQSKLHTQPVTSLPVNGQLPQPSFQATGFTAPVVNGYGSYPPGPQISHGMPPSTIGGPQYSQYPSGVPMGSYPLPGLANGVPLSNGFPSELIPGALQPQMANGYNVPTMPRSSVPQQLNGFGMQETSAVPKTHLGPPPQDIHSTQPGLPQSSYPLTTLSADMFKPPRLATSVPYTSTVAGEVPRTFLTPTLPIPSTVGMSVPTSDRPSDHLKKVKEYQLSLLQKHEQSKRVLAETRAEIERRRQQLLERFPQLDLKSGDSDRGSSGSQSTAESKSEVTKEPRLLTGSTLSPNKAAMSTLLSQLASQPYYVSRLSHPKEDGDQGQRSAAEQAKFSQPQSASRGGASEQDFDKVRKSLPFDADDTIHATPDLSGLSRPRYAISPGSTTDDLDDTAMTSSTERGSPALAGGRTSSYTTGTESEQDRSLLSVAKERNDFFEKRQQELKKQLEEIQRQKEEILQKHNVGHLKLQEQKQVPGAQSQQQQQQQRETPSFVRSLESDEETSGTDSSSDLSPVSVSTHPASKKGTSLLEQHQPHQLSTIQEVDSPTSTRLSSHAMSGRPSLSSSDRSSVSRTSTEAAHHAPIPEGREEARPVPTVSVQPPVMTSLKDTGYQTSQIEEALARASEFSPSILTNLRKQTNDVFYSLKEDDSLETPHKSSMLSLSTGPVTPDSFSTGPLEGRETSGATFNSYASPASDSSAFKQQKPAGQTMSTEDSYQSGKSWAEELASYNGKFQPLQPERVSLDDKSETSFRPMKQSLDSDAGPTDKSVDRSYKVLHFTPREDASKEEAKESDSSESFHLKAHSPSDLRASELSQYPLSGEGSVRSSRSGSGKSSPSNTASLSNKSNKDNDLQPSLASTMTESIQSCASSYMELKVDNGNQGMREFDFIGRSRIPQVRTGDSDDFPQKSQQFEGSLEYTSTPNMKDGQTKGARLSQISQYTVSPEESRIQAGSTNLPAFTGQFTHVKPSTDQSFGVVSTQPQAFTKVPGSNFLSRVSEESMDSSKSVHSSTKDMTKLKEDSSLSQFSITDPSSTELSLTQITLEHVSPEKSRPEMPSLSQYTVKSSPESSGKDNSSLSQYSMDSSQHRLSDTNNSNTQGLSGVSNGDSQIEDEDDAFVEKKFANLDQLIRESKDLITKHKAMIDKNKLLETGSREGTPTPPPLPKTEPPVMREVLPQPFVETMPQDAPLTRESLHSDNTTRISEEPTSHLTDSSHMLDLEKFGQESGITDEPDLTLISMSSTQDLSQLGEVTQDVSQSGEVTHRSETSTASDSILSFEQHERSLRSTPDKEFQDNLETLKDAGMPTKPVVRDAGDENVFHAVPAVVSPTLALSMKFNSNQQQFKKPPVSWSYGDEDEKKGAKMDVETGDKPIVSKVVENKGKPDSTKKSVASEKSGLNRALQPRGGKPATSLSSASKTDTKQTTGTKSKAMGLGDFLSSAKEGHSVLGKRTKQPPPVKPKPQRRPAGTTDIYNATATGPSVVVPTTSELTKTLSSWKKSRGVRPGPAPPIRSQNLPQPSVTMSQDGLAKSNEEKPYEDHMRLQSRIEEGQLTRSKPEEKQKQAAAHKEKVKEFQKKLQENMKKKQQMKKLQQKSM